MKRTYLCLAHFLITKSFRFMEKLHLMRACLFTLFLTIMGGVNLYAQATLPVTYTGNGSNISSAAGFTGSGLGDYKDTTTPISFTKQGNTLTLHFDSAPGVLSYYIKGNSFSGGTFTVYIGTNGTDYTVLKQFTTEITNSNTLQTHDLTAKTDVRYIKWEYTTKSNGNVGIGTISLAKPAAGPMQVIAPEFSAADKSTFTDQLQLQLTSETEGATIYYTTDLNAAQSTFTTLPADGLTLSATTTVRAFAKKSGMDDSEEVQATFRKVREAIAQTIWSEDFSAATTNNAKVSTLSRNGVTYTSTDGNNKGTTSIYTTNGASAGGELPELLIAKGSGTLTVNLSALSLQAGAYDLSFLTNRKELTVSTTTEGVTLAERSQGHWSVTLAQGLGQIELTFTNTSSGSNARIDNICLAQYKSDKVTLLAPEGYGTLYSDLPFLMPEGLEGGIVTAAGDDGALTVDYRYPAGSAVPAFTGLLLKGKKGEYAYTFASETPAEPADNLLSGSTDERTTAVAGEAAYYKLTYRSDSDKTLGFYYGADGGEAFTNAPYRAFLAVPAAMQSAAGYALIGGEATGIEQVAPSTPASAAIYTLSGVRVPADKALPKGIYLQGGKKVFIP